MKKTMIIAVIGLLVMVGVGAVADDTLLMRAAATAIAGCEPGNWEGHWYFKGDNLYKDGVVLASRAAVAATTNDPAVIAAADALIEAENRPTIMPKGIEIPVGRLLIVPSYTNNLGFAIFASDGGVVLSEKIHGSPWKTEAEFNSNVLERIAALNIIRGNANKPIITNPEKIAIMWEFFKLQHNLDFDN